MHHKNVRTKRVTFEQSPDNPYTKFILAKKSMPTREWNWRMHYRQKPKLQAFNRSLDQLSSFTYQVHIWGLVERVLEKYLTLIMKNNFYFYLLSIKYLVKYINFILNLGSAFLKLFT